MRVIVAAAGPQAKWGGHLGVRSHFAPVRGRLDGGPVLPLLELTLSHLSALTADVWLTVPPEEPEPYEALAAVYGVRVHRAVQGSRSEFESSMPVWGDTGRTVLLLGDVWFTDAALAAILTDPADGVRVFGRAGPSRVTGTPYGEIFAVSWPGSADRRMRELAAEIGAGQAAGCSVRPGWVLLRTLQGTPLHEHTVCAPWWVEIDDATDDIDFPEDFQRHPATRGCA
ncbi:hypothetical protein WB388_08635 [Streptomyces brasiliscabiei]|uniref:MobA-like NTP transferase domain-containing protein n=1 Tax=Streptomyces brasiliscabiei TaxID=2736302 RepID=A0ABU8GA45_9ACTN